MLPCVRARSRGLTMVELLVAIGILSVLGLALAQLMSTGMATWRSGEVRRGAYERAQYVFDRVRSDLAELQPRDPEMPEAWVFQDYWLPGSFELHSGTVEEIGETGGKSDPDAEMSVGQDAEAGTVYLAPTAPGSEASIEYEIKLPFAAKTVVIEPRIALKRSAGCSGPETNNCWVCVDTAIRASDEHAWSAYATQARFISGLRDETIMPGVALDSDDLASDARQMRVRLRIEPRPGQSSDARLFETATDRLDEPVFRLTASPRDCQTGVRLVSSYRSDHATQYLVFVRSDHGLREAAYFLEDDALYRAERSGVGGSGSLFAGPPPLESPPAGTTVARVVEDLIYFGCAFQSPDGGEQLYWNEAGSVPPRVRLVVTTIPLSGPAAQTSLRAAAAADDTTLAVNGTRGFILGDRERQVVKIGDEWIRYGALGDDRLLGCTRGVRGTLPAAHGKGAAVTAGETFRADVSIPAWGYRDR